VKTSPWSATRCLDLTQFMGRSCCPTPALRLIAAIRPRAQLTAQAGSSASRCSLTAGPGTNPSATGDSSRNPVIPQRISPAVGPLQASCGHCGRTACVTRLGWEWGLALETESRASQKKAKRGGPYSKAGARCVRLR
jgi:hypothetical protein